MGKITRINLLFDVRKFFSGNCYEREPYCRLEKLLGNIKGINIYYLMDRRIERGNEDKKECVFRINPEKQFFLDSCMDDIDVYVSEEFEIPEAIKNIPEITKYIILRDVLLSLHGNKNSSWFEETIQVCLENYDYFVTFTLKLKQELLSNIRGINEDRILVWSMYNDAIFGQQLNSWINEKKSHDERLFVAFYKIAYHEEMKNAVMGFVKSLKESHKEKKNDIFTLIILEKSDKLIQQINDLIIGYEKNFVFKDELDDEEMQEILQGAFSIIDTFRLDDFNPYLFEAIKYNPVIISNSIALNNEKEIIYVEDSVPDYKVIFDKFISNDESLENRLYECNIQENISQQILNTLIEIENRKRETPLVTVVTITYNLIKAGREKTIKQCIESVHNQSYKNIEHIIIDGASNDGTLDLLAIYSQRNWIRIYSEPDDGLYDAMNKGIGRAHGKYLAFLNSDDYYSDLNGIQKCVCALQKVNADYGFSDANILNEDNSIYNWIADIGNILYARNYCHQSMFVRLAVLKELGGFDLRYKVSSDSDLMIRALEKGYSYIKVEYPFVTYRGGGLSAVTAEESRRDHSYSFYLHIGKKCGLTSKDCYELWQYRFFDELPVNQQIRLVSKVPSFFNSEMVLNEIKRREEQKKSIGIKKLIAQKFPFKKFHISRHLRVRNGRNEMVYYFCKRIPIWITKERL